IHVFLVPLANTEFSRVPFVIPTFFFYVKYQKLHANSNWMRYHYVFYKVEILVFHIHVPAARMSIILLEGFGGTHVGHILGVGCLFNLCIYLVPYLPGCTAFSKAFYRIGSYFNPCWTNRYTNNQSIGGRHCINLGALADLVHQYIFLCLFQSCPTLLTPPSKPVSCSFSKHVILFHLFLNLL
uniref:Uncharacterized protein n=1 Tax=Solanum lycopersicum TaxID=4081 RepID=A0A3Q7J7K9_SOLLC